jgi:hypothetical protein
VLAAALMALLSPNLFSTAPLPGPTYRGADVRAAFNPAMEKPDRGKKIVNFALHTHQIGGVVGNGRLSFNTKHYL